MSKIKHTIMEQIDAGVIEMRPRWYFIVRAGLAASLLLLGLLFLLYITNFMLFVLVSSGAVRMPLFGVMGLMEFLYEVPWILALTTLSLFVFLYVLVKRFSFAYRTPILVTVTVMIATVAFGSAFIFMSPLNELIEARLLAGHRGVPERLHEWYGSEPKRVMEGQIRTMSPEILELEGVDREHIVVRILPETKLPLQTLQIGDWILIFGPQRDGIVEAIGVKFLRPAEKESMPAY